MFPTDDVTPTAARQWPICGAAPTCILLALARCVDVFVEDLIMSFKLVSKQRKTSNAVGMSPLIC